MDYMQLIETWFIQGFIDKEAFSRICDRDRRLRENIRQHYDLMHRINTKANGEPKPDHMAGPQQY